MQQQTFYHSGGQRVSLFDDQNLFTVRFTRAAQLDVSRLSGEARQTLDASRLVTFLAREELHVFHHDAAPDATNTLRCEAEIEQAYPVFRRTPGGRDSIIVTSRLLTQFCAEVSRERILATLEELRLRILEPLSYASPNGFLLEAEKDDDGLGAVNAANTLVERKLVVFAEPDVLQSRHWKGIDVPDPNVADYLSNQWHLAAVGAQKAWTSTEGNPAIRIAILDDGLDMGHEEFFAPVASGQPKVADQFDFGDGIADASPKTYIDSHGTACAGVAAASGVHASGVAPGCRLLIARTPEYLGVSDEAKMFLWAADMGADVISCSWGPADGTGTTVPLPEPTRLSIRYCLTNGRAGKGIPIFWAAGNGSESVSTDGYASNPDVMAIAACSASEEIAPYSDYGPEIFACTPSNSIIGRPAIFTSDRRGTAGYNPGSAGGGDAAGDYTRNFGGTSAAAPLAAGIAALMLSVNPGMTAAALRGVLRRTADPIGGVTYDAVGHSDHFGYGRLNAARAVEDAQALSSSPQFIPVILGPQSCSRTDFPPKFQVDPSPNSYYFVEVATQPELFDIQQHAAERTPNNFYGSWADSPLQTSPVYILPAPVWDRMRLANRLWYRAGSSSSPAAYVDYAISTRDDQGEAAPMVEVLPGNGPPPKSTRSCLTQLGWGTEDSVQPRITGPIRWDRSGPPPSFRVDLPKGTSCVELSASGNEGDWKPLEWVVEGPVTNDPSLAVRAFTVPFELWERFLEADRLFYRLTVPGEDPASSQIFTIQLFGSRCFGLSSHLLIREDELLWRQPKAALEPAAISKDHLVLIPGGMPGKKTADTDAATRWADDYEN
jgi:subtilisin family serine protease